jgi:hypothetical protein
MADATNGHAGLSSREAEAMVVALLPHCRLPFLGRLKLTLVGDAQRAALLRHGVIGPQGAVGSQAVGFKGERE